MNENDSDPENEIIEEVVSVDVQHALSRLGHQGIHSLAIECCASSYKEKNTLYTTYWFRNTDDCLAFCKILNSSQKTTAQIKKIKRAL